MSLLNWYLLEVEMNLGHAHKTRFWYLLGVFSKFPDKHLRHFYKGVTPLGDLFGPKQSKHFSKEITTVAKTTAIIDTNS